MKREVRAELAGRYEAAVSPGGDLLVAVDVVQVGGGWGGGEETLRSS